MVIRIEIIVKQPFLSLSWLVKPTDDGLESEGRNGAQGHGHREMIASKSAPDLLETARTSSRMCFAPLWGVMKRKTGQHRAWAVQRAESIICCMCRSFKWVTEWLSDRLTSLIRNTFLAQPLRHFCRVRLAFRFRSCLPVAITRIPPRCPRSRIHPLLILRSIPHNPLSLFVRHLPRVHSLSFIWSGKFVYVLVFNSFVICPFEFVRSIHVDYAFPSNSICFSMEKFAMKNPNSLSTSWKKFLRHFQKLCLAWNFRIDFCSLTSNWRFKWI